MNLPSLYLDPNIQHAKDTIESSPPTNTRNHFDYTPKHAINESNPLLKNQKRLQSQPKNSTFQSDSMAQNSLFEYSRDLGSSGRSHFQSDSMTMQSGIQTAQNVQRRTKPQQDQLPQSIANKLGSAIIKDQFTDVNLTSQYDPYNLQQPPNIELTTSVNFENFKQNSSKLKRNFQNKNFNTVCQGRSIQEWSQEIKHQFCRGFTDAASTSQRGSTLASGKRQPQTGYESTRLRNTLHNSTFERRQVPTTSVKTDSQNDDMLVFESERNINSVQTYKSSVAENSLESQTSQGIRSVKYKIFKSQQQRDVAQLINQRIDQQCAEKFAQQTEVSHLSALRKCNLIVSAEKNNSRQALLRKITKRSMPPIVGSQSSQRQSLLDAKRLSQESVIIQKQNFRTIRTSAEKRAIYQEAKKLEEKAMLNDGDKLWRKLHDQVSKKQYYNLEQDTTEPVLRSRFQSVHSGSGYSNTLNISKSGYRQTKYLGLGEIGEFYARKEYDQAQMELRQDEELITAAKTKIFQPWTAERVASRFTKQQPEKIRLLIERNKKMEEPHEQMKKQFDTKLGHYINDLSKSVNLNFLGQSANSGQVQSSHKHEHVLSIAEKQKEQNELNQLNSQSSVQLSIKSQNQSPQRSPLMTPNKRRQRRPNIKIDNLEKHISRGKAPFDMNKLVDQLVQKNAFQQVCKRTALSTEIAVPVKKDRNEQLTNENLRQQYFVNAKQSKEPIFDLLSKIQEGRLILEEYSLGIGQCQGFNKVCQLEPELLNSVFMENCGLDKDAMLVFMRALSYQKNIQKICFKRQQIDSESAQILSNILEQSEKVWIKDLRLEKCEITITGMTQILQNILQNDQIQSLAIVGQTLTQDQINLLCKIIQTDYRLTNLDLSNSRISAVNFLPILKAMSENKRLAYINISWNKILKNTNFAPIGFEVKTELEDTRSYSSCLRAHSTMSEPGGERSSSPIKNLRSEHDQVVLDTLTTILKSEKLYHIDLSELGLTSDIIGRLVPHIKYSTSLIGVHLSGNPGLNPEIERRILLRLKAVYEKPLKLESFQQLIQREQPKVDLRQKSPRQRQNKLVMETLFIKDTLNKKRIDLNLDESSISNPQSRHFILTRKLGHNMEIPGSQTWSLFKENCNQCYICDRKIYTIFFWSPQIGTLEGADLGLTADEQYKIAQFIIQDRERNELRHRLQTTIDPNLCKKLIKDVFNEQTGEFEEVEENETFIKEEDDNSDIEIDKNQVTLNDENCEFGEKKFKQVGSSILMKQIPRFANSFKMPMLYGEFNNWQPQPMIPVYKLAMAFENKRSPPDLLTQTKKLGLCREAVTNVKQLKKNERENYAKILQQYRHRFYQNEMWTDALRKLIAYSDPHFTSAIHLKQIDTIDLHVAANFVGCGRQDYVVQHHNQFYFHQTLASYRTEDIVFPKLVLAGKGKIERNPNVFKSWQTDTPEWIEECATNDFQFWKIEKFVKDPEDIKEIALTIRQNYVLLKDIFSIIAASSFPCVSSLECGVMISECGLLAKDFTQGIVDTQFIASRVDVDKRGFKIHNQNALDCNRFEFLECIVRIAQNKFKITGQCNTVGQAVKMLIEVIKSQFEGELAQDFRNEQLWTREVNLTFDANRVLIKQLYDKLKRNNKMSQDEALKLMTQQTRIRLSDSDAMYCYAMSLQTCQDIMKNSYKQMWHIELLEFMEMIGRVADCYSLDADTPLHVKINKVLDEWFTLINATRQESVYFQEIGSDSDED